MNVVQTDKVKDKGILFCSFEVHDIICVTEIWSRALLQSKGDGTDVWLWLCLSLGVWSRSLWPRAPGTLPLNNDLQEALFQLAETWSSQDAGKASVLRGSKGSHLLS